MWVVIVRYRGGDGATVRTEYVVQSQYSSTLESLATCATLQEGRLPCARGPGAPPRPPPPPLHVAAEHRYTNKLNQTNTNALWNGLHSRYTSTHTIWMWSARREAPNYHTTLKIKHKKEITKIYPEKAILTY